MSVPRKIHCHVESITDHGGRVFTVDLAPASPVPSFRPGQFLHLTVDEYDPSGFWPESRVFSIASPPHDCRRLRICYSVKGRYTMRMEQMLRVGGEVWVKLPYGEFFIDHQADAVLVAGGTGISAFTAFLGALTSETKQKATLVYGARNPDLFLFQEMILSQLARVPAFNVIFFTETRDATFAGRMAALPNPPKCFPGRISLSSVLRPPASDIGPLTSDLRSLPSEARPLSSVIGPPSSDLRSLSSVLCPPSSVFYLSGPPIMLKALGEDLKSRGVPPDRIRTDAWE
jgi:NAD(P)H-flavin reductase